MKRVFLIPMILLVFSTNAQEMDFRERVQERHNEMTNEQKAIIKAKQMTLALDLSEKQQEQFQSLELQKIQEKEQLKNEMNLGTGKRAKKDMSTDEIFALRNARLDKMIAFKQKVKTILSKDQYAKWEELRLELGIKRHRQHQRKDRGRRG
ncbi:hypothetical protein [Eudoraea chungangensis]|uniref:hypothetical protein n=1 Tax=Eudoraea chungangensis TaxID=1481905 RepID=UPI0023EAD758|nr:hypothetical protein [Eudoraea chungangensis]